MSPKSAKSGARRERGWSDDTKTQQIPISEVPAPQLLTKISCVLILPPHTWCCSAHQAGSQPFLLFPPPHPAARTLPTQ